MSHETIYQAIYVQGKGNLRRELGTNENTTGLLRQYFAKGADLSIFPAGYLDYIAVKLNNRPPKTLGWKTPAEALDELLSNPIKPPAVASTA